MRIKIPANAKGKKTHDRFISAPRSAEEADLQRAILDGLFDYQPSSTDYSDALCDAFWKQSFTTIAESSILGSALTEKSFIPLRRTTAIQSTEFLDVSAISNNYYNDPFCWGDNLVYMGLGSSLFEYNFTRSSSPEEIQAGYIEGSNITALAYHSDSLMRADDKGHVTLINTNTLTETRTILSDHARDGYSAIRTDGEKGYFMLASNQKFVSYYDTRCYTPKIKSLLQFNNRYIVGLAYNPSEQTLALSADSSILLYDRRKSREPKLEFKGHNSSAKGLTFVPAESKIASGGGTTDQTIQIWSTLDGSLDLKANTKSQICGIHAINKNRFFVTEGHYGNKVSCWSKKGNKLVMKESNSLHNAQVFFSAQNPSNANQFVTGSLSKTVGIWSVVECTNKQTKKDKSKSLVILGIR